ncbi:4-hydroxyphenylpyruvate dioxygenase [Streptomyces sp. NBC_00006]|uniref:4-hydroxyphenylpyruvate dioxygenase n=1 Tax=unclassified Streptomyces TaxID=2593676 RepID=UPI0022558BE5|nr:MULTISPECIES: 4-hydroxyphenylpyruvate dioxygenase [unclassified Streptomyces]MCX5536354.1 4-hydroxyphenylpyruvate dioxygenase [Streptomyces sp. NBC_00006]
MAVHDVAYVELYTSKKKSVVDYFVSSMGFRQTAESVGVDRSSALLQQGSVKLVVTTGPATWEFLGTHGDGIADIALACDDVDQSARSAVAAGASMTASTKDTRTVSGFGGVVHTLVSRTHGSGLFGGPDWAALPDGSSSPGTGRIQLLDHIAICVEGRSLAGYADFYSDAFGLSRYSSEYVDVGEHAMDSVVVRSSSGRVTFTLVAPDQQKGTGQLDAFLERNSGPGVQHLAFLVESIVHAVHEFGDRGVEFLDVPDSYYDGLAERLPGLRAEIDVLRSAQVLADRDEWGDLLQLFSRSPHERNTLFYELIQRRGSRGFGGGNIRALYEAVERDRLAAE